jgi:tetrahydromethanopterin S-methyltransferase subunit G
MSTDTGDRSLAERMAGVEGQLEQMNERIGSIEHRMDAHDGRFDTIDSRLNSLDRKVDGVDEKIGRVESRMLQRMTLIVGVATAILAGIQLLIV